MPRSRTLTAKNSRDEDLLQAARGGDRAALEALLLRYQPQVYGFGMRMCRDPEDAKDVLQDTLFAMARSIRNFRGNSSMSTWIYAIARSFCVKKRRQGRSVVTTALDVDSTSAAAASPTSLPSPGPEQQAESREVEAMLAGAIAALAPKYREVLVLRDLEGLSAAQVAEVLRITVDTVKSRLHRARLAVRDALAPVLDRTGTGPRRRPGETCPDVLRLFSRHLEGEISADLCAEMERHVERCAACRKACASLQRTLKMCRTLPSPRVPTPVQDAVRAQVRELIAKRF